MVLSILPYFYNSMVIYDSSSSNSNSKVLFAFDGVDASLSWGAQAFSGTFAVYKSFLKQILFYYI